MTMGEALYRLQAASLPHVRAELRHSPDAALEWLRRIGKRVDALVDAGDVDGVLELCVLLEAGRAA